MDTHNLMLNFIVILFYAFPNDFIWIYKFLKKKIYLNWKNE